MLDVTCGTKDTTNCRTEKRGRIRIHRQVWKGVSGGEHDYGHGSGSAHMKVE